jgi:putative peptidoglycan lipid II flippase
MTVLIAAASLLTPADGSRLIWLVIAILAGELAASTMVLVRLRQMIYREQFIEFRTLAGALAATAATVPVAVAVRWLDHVISRNQLDSFAVLALGGSVALGVYAIALWFATRRRTGTAS